MTVLSGYGSPLGDGSVSQHVASAAAVASRPAAVQQPALPGQRAGTATTAGVPAPPATPQGTVYGGAAAAKSKSRRVRRRGSFLPRLRIGYHLASESTLAGISLATTATGLVLGHDRDNRMVSLRLFRPEPTRVVVIGGQWLSTVVLLRALALGARLAVVAAQPENWDGFAAWATGREDRVAVLPVNQPVVPPASAAEPGLLFWDGGLLGPSAPMALGPWQTQVTLLRQLTAHGAQALQEAGVVMMQRLTPAEAEIVASVLKLDAESRQLVQVLGDDMVAMLGNDANRYVWVTPTTAEHQYLGAPRR